MKPDWRWHLIQYKFQEHKIVQSFELFRRHGIEPLLIKGWAAARNYPSPHERVFLDTDICVAPADYVQARQIAAGEEEQKLLIDLHCGLRHLDTVAWDDLFADTVLCELEGTPIRILRAEDHLRVLCVHWLNDGGEYRERLRDIYYAVENRPADFDWDRCLAVVEPKRRRWIVCAIALARQYLGLNLENTPIALEAERIPEWITETVEKEWASEIRLLRLHECLADRKELFRQLRKRFPPNPIQATIEMGGEFDDRSRIYYQLASILFRVKPSARRIAGLFFKD